MLGAALELFALWRIGSKLEQMDRRQAAMNGEIYPDLPRPAPILPRERIEPRLYPDEPAPASSWRNWYDAQESGDGFAWEPAAAPADMITVHPVALPAPKISEQKVKWWGRLVRWLAS